MKLYNITSKREYEKEGVKKTAWFNVGTLKVTPEGKMFIQLNILPNESFYVFERERQATQTTQESKPSEVVVEDSDIPF